MGFPILVRWYLKILNDAIIKTILVQFWTRIMYNTTVAINLKTILVQFWTRIMYNTTVAINLKTILVQFWTRIMYNTTVAINLIPIKYRKDNTLLVLKIKNSGRTKSMPWLRMPCKNISVSWNKVSMTSANCMQTKPTTHQSSGIQHHPLIVWLPNMVDI